MPETKPMKSLPWLPKTALAVAIFISLGLLILPLLRPLEFGDTSVRANAGFLKPGQGFDTEPSGFISTGWDGPTGEFSHGSIYGLKLGNWMYRIDVATEPLARAEGKLPNTIPGLVEALNSQEPYMRNAAARELSRRGLVVDNPPTGYLISPSNTNVAEETNTAQ